MQIRVTLLRGGAARNILIRADATATATDVANAILSEGLSEPFQSSEGRPTLRVQDPLGRARVLAADAAVVLSPEESRRFLDALDNPFQPNAKLKKAMEEADRLLTR